MSTKFKPGQIVYHFEPWELPDITINRHVVLAAFSNGQYDQLVVADREDPIHADRCYSSRSECVAALAKWIGEDSRRTTDRLTNLETLESDLRVRGDWPEDHPIETAPEEEDEEDAVTTGEPVRAAA